jgi:hypothetical protein
MHVVETLTTLKRTLLKAAIGHRSLCAVRDSSTSIYNVQPYLLQASFATLLYGVNQETSLRAVVMI